MGMPLNVNQSVSGKIDETYEDATRVALGNAAGGGDGDGRPSLGQGEGDPHSDDDRGRDSYNLSATITTPPRATDMINGQTVAPTVGEVGLGAGMLTLWLAVFAVGLLVPSIYFRESIQATFVKLLTVTSATSAATRPSGEVVIAASAAAPIITPRNDLAWYGIVGYGLLTVVTFTMTNLFFLAMSASFLGAMAKRWASEFVPLFGDALQPETSRRLADARLEVKREYLNAALRGFLAYLLFIAGYLILLPEDVLKSGTPSQYIRLSGALSALAFVVGYEPGLAGRMLSKLMSIGTSERQQADLDLSITRKAKSPHAPSTADKDATAEDAKESEHTPVPSERGSGRHAAVVGGGVGTNSQRANFESSIDPAVVRKFAEFLRRAEEQKAEGTPQPGRDSAPA